MAITKTAVCDYDLCGVELDPETLPVRAHVTYRDGEVVRQLELHACTPGHLALAIPAHVQRDG